MGFDFNPLVWFVCKLCRQTFSDPDKLKAHKLQSHLWDCLRIKCIVFEEKFLDHEWIPPDKLHHRHNPYPGLHLSSNNEVFTLKNSCANERVNINANTNVTPFEKEKDFYPNVSLRERKGAHSSSSSACLFNTQTEDEAEIQGGIENEIQIQPSSSGHSKRIKYDDDDVEIIHKKLNEPSIQIQTKETNLEASDKNSQKDNCKIGIKSEPEPDSLLIIPLDFSDDIDKTTTPDDFLTLPSLATVIPTIRSLVPRSRSTVIQASKSRSISISASALTSPQEEFDLEFLHEKKSHDEIDQNPYSQASNRGNFNPASSVKVEFIEDSVTIPNNHRSNKDKNQIQNRDILPNLDCEQIVVSPIISISDSIFQPHFLEGESSSHNYNTSSNQSQHQNANNININGNTNVNVNVENNNVVKPFMCETCFAVFDSKSGLARHMVSHSSDRPFKCPFCPAAYKYNQLLRNHLIVHGRQTPHNCRYCGKSFHSKTVVDNHERTHTGDRPFKCQVRNCDFTFRFQSSLIVHTRMKHSEELGLQQFVCPTCGRTFGLKCYLKRHIQTHHGKNWGVRSSSTSTSI